MTETTGSLSNHPKSHLQHWSNQLWLTLTRVTDRPFLEARKSFKLSYSVLARFGSLFPCIMFGTVHFCQWLKHGQFSAQRPFFVIDNIVSQVVNCFLGEKFSFWLALALLDFFSFSMRFQGICHLPVFLFIHLDLPVCLSSCPFVWTQFCSFVSVAGLNCSFTLKSVTCSLIAGLVLLPTERLWHLHQLPSDIVRYLITLCKNVPLWLV